MFLSGIFPYLKIKSVALFIHFTFRFCKVFAQNGALSLKQPSLTLEICSVPAQNGLSALGYTVACTHVLCFHLSPSPHTHTHRLLLSARETTAHRYRHCLLFVCVCVCVCVCCFTSYSVHCGAVSPR